MTIMWRMCYTGRKFCAVRVCSDGILDAEEALIDFLQTYRSINTEGEYRISPFFMECNFSEPLIFGAIVIILQHFYFSKEVFNT